MKNHEQSKNYDFSYSMWTEYLFQKIDVESNFGAYSFYLTSAEIEITRLANYTEQNYEILLFCCTSSVITIAELSVHLFLPDGLSDPIYGVWKNDPSKFRIFQHAYYDSLASTSP